MPILALLLASFMAAASLAGPPVPPSASPARLSAAPTHYADPMRESLTKTPLGPLELAAVLRDAHVAVFGREPSMHRLAVAWAQTTLEGARKGFCHNLGSIGVPDSNHTTPYVIVGGARFAAAPTYRDGAERYWRTLRDNFPHTLAMFDYGDGYQAGLGLGKGGYHRSDSEDYAAKMRSLVGTFWRVVAGVL